MSERAGHDTEITLGTGRLLGLFFTLAMVCAVFFALGYSMGRKSVPGPVAQTDVPAPPIAVKNAPKPAASTAEEEKPTEDCADCATPSTSDELTFYKAVEKKDGEAELEKPATAESAVKNAAAPEFTSTAPPGYVVQIAAVTKREDAEALVGALRKKQYPVFVMDSAANDQFFRVQVGPFTQLKEAEAMKAKLQGDGYNPILRK